MPTGIEVIKAALDDFKKIQEYMLLARKENATETYANQRRKSRRICLLFHFAAILHFTMYQRKSAR